MACPSRKSFDEIFSKVILGQHVHCARIQMNSLGAQMTETLSLSMLSSKIIIWNLDITTNDQSQFSLTQKVTKMRTPYSTVLESY